MKPWSDVGNAKKAREKSSARGLEILVSSFPTATCSQLFYLSAHGTREYKD